MKKVLLLIILLVSGIQVFAQVTDIKYLVNKTPREIVNLYPGSTLVEDAMWDYGYGKVINNNGFFRYETNSKVYVTNQQTTFRILLYLCNQNIESNLG